MNLELSKPFFSLGRFWFIMIQHHTKFGYKWSIGLENNYSVDTIWTKGQTDTQAHKHTYTQTHGHTDTGTHRHIDTWKHRHIDTQAHGHTDIQTQ